MDRTWAEQAQAPHYRDLALHTHDLRHTCASLRIQLGAHPKAIHDRLGHSDIGVTLNVYGHLFPSLGEHLTDALEALRRSATGS